ncbi:MAG: hypothetical protein M3Z17_01685 [Gemmatimonadota bacterium]|nr:hypothetical protein [Gemmatimonadota bacterium]
MDEKRYNQDEVAAIFERASETEAKLPATGAGAGLTLGELHGIAKEVGISPQSITQAAQSLELAARPAPIAKFIGVPIGVARTVEIDRPLNESEWERLVADLRTTFSANGKLRYDGPFRQWTNGNLKAVVEPTSAGSRIRLQTTNGNARTMMTIGIVFLGVGGATFITDAAASGASAASASGLELMALLGIGFFAAGALRVSGWARQRALQFDEVLARLTK